MPTWATLAHANWEADPGNTVDHDNTLFLLPVDFDDLGYDNTTISKAPYIATLKAELT
jgi:hypothetical protein